MNKGNTSAQSRRSQSPERDVTIAVKAQLTAMLYLLMLVPLLHGCGEAEETSDSSSPFPKNQDARQLVSMIDEFIEPDGRKNSIAFLPPGDYARTMPAGIWEKHIDLYVYYSEKRFAIKPGTKTVSIPKGGFLVAELSEPLSLDLLSVLDGIDIVDAKDGDAILAGARTLSLKFIAVRDVILGNTGIKVINSMKELSHLSLYGVQSDSFDQLQNQSVTFLDLNSLDKERDVIACLNNFQNIEDLRMKNCSISASVAAAICKGHPRLKILCLNSTGLEDAEFNEIVRSKQLVRLELHNSLVTDSGLKNLATQKKLDRLNLSGSAITDQGLEYVAQVPTITVLDLGRTKITDDGLAQIKKLKKLRLLGLTNISGMTARGMTELAGVPSLENLSLRGTELPLDKLQELQRRLPKCEIH